jgi:APA family basic amino acid/polyamine antiporter
MQAAGSAAAGGIPTSAEEGGFVRKASGLVRAWSPFDAWVYNVFAVNVIAQVALVYVIIPATYPGARTWVAVLVASVFCVAEALVYALLVSAMPRSGGDYVFQSRILGGAWATIFAFTLIALSAAIFMALAGFLGATVIFGPFLTLLGAAYHVHWMGSVGSWFNTHTGIFVMGCACTLWGAIVTALGMRFYALVQRWFFAVAAGCLLIMFVALLVSSADAFRSHLDSLAANHFGVKHAYETILARAPKHSIGFALGASILAAVPASFTLIYPGWSAQTSGEIKRASNVRSNAYAIVGAAAFSGIVMAVLAALLSARVGERFLYASGSLFYNDPAHYPLPISPFFGFLVALVPGHTFFIWVAFIMFNAWFWMWFPNIPLAGSRVLVAMSFDRVLPEWLGRVNPRTHTPVNAIIVYSIPMIGLCALYAYITTFYKLTLGLAVQGIAAIAITMVAAILLPYKKPSLFETTGVSRYRLFGVPLIVPAAATFLAFSIFTLEQYFRDTKLGINGKTGLIFVGATYAVALLTYVVARVYRKQKEGLDLGMVYRELPIE